MTPFIRHHGIVAPLPQTNIDTDQIIPKQFLKRIEKSGFGAFLFHDWRTLSDGSPNPDFLLNQPPYTKASILVAGANFGCGSSREHAPWALVDFGFKALIAPSFADIFYNNCFQNGLLPVVLPDTEVSRIIRLAADTPGFSLTVDLEKLTVTSEDGSYHTTFAVEPHRRQSLMEGLDAIGQTLNWANEISQYERNHPAI